MNNQIHNLFQNKANQILSIYVTAGFPQLEDTLQVCKLLEEVGVDLIELGIPFSDSLVDGPTIQHANEVALANGMTLSILFEQLKDLKNAVSIPVILMGCVNPIEQYGWKAFCEDCSRVGIAGAIIPDLPPELYELRYKSLFDSKELSYHCLVTQHTTEDRIRYLDSLSSGFLYAVSSDGITGGLLEKDLEREAYLDRLSKLELKNPCLLGFGISCNKTLAYAFDYCAGGIIGSAFIRALEAEGSIEDNIKSFVGAVR